MPIVDATIREIVRRLKLRASYACAEVYKALEKFDPRREEKSDGTIR
jgi:hypothetical protein